MCYVTYQLLKREIGKKVTANDSQNTENKKKISTISGSKKLYVNRRNKKKEIKEFFSFVFISLAKESVSKKNI